MNTSEQISDDGWLRTFIPRNRITVDEAAFILAGDVRELVPGWWNSIVDAVDSGQIEASTWGADRGQQRLDHADIRAWCERNGVFWPIPLPRPIKASTADVDAELRGELDRALARIAELERERVLLPKKIKATSDAGGTISSPTLQRIIEAVDQYPAWRAAQNQEPNLKAVLAWQEVQQEGKGNASRVAHVAHHVIAEHFGLKS